MENSVHIQLLGTDQLDENTLQLSKDIFEKWNLNDRNLYTIQCGQKTNTIFIKPIDQTHTLRCSKEFLTTLYLQPQMQLQLFFDEKNLHFRLGPIIGLLLKPFKNNDLGSLASYCEELSIYSKKKSIAFYVFSLANWYQDFVKGYVWEANKWIQQSLPKPDVIHNRIQSRGYEKRSDVQDFFECVTKNNIPFFNDHFLNKWEVYEILSQHDHLKPYLPDTVLLNGKNTLEEMIRNYHYLFVKPVHGSQGKQIYRINANDIGFKVDYSTFSGEVENQFSSIPELYRSLRSRFANQRFIIQKGLDLLTYQDRPLDFRVLCHQEKGQWKVTSAVARVSNEGAFVSNLSQGGEQHKIKSLLDDIYKDATALHMRKMILEVSIEVVSLLNQELHGLYGELGVDIAIDQRNHPWIIEVNTKPSKNFNNDNVKIRPSSRAIINHCEYLAIQSYSTDLTSLRS